MNSLDIVSVLEDMLPGRRPIPLHEPEFKGTEWQYVKDCVDTAWVSSAGEYVDRFEQSLSEWTGVAHAVAVVNGTAALHVSLRLAGVRAGDEVLVPALSFVATAAAVRYLGAIPHFVDVDESTLGMNPAALAHHLENIADSRGHEIVNRNTGRRIAAVVPMHTFGHPVDIGPLVDLCDRFGLPVVEDAAESLGSYRDGAHTGSWGLLGAVSFNGNKIVTTGGGGAVLTGDGELAAHVRHLTTTAKVPHPWEYRHDELGYNFRLPNINAALGVAQMEALPGFIERKRELASRYARAFAEYEGVRFVREPSGCRSNYWLNTLVLPRQQGLLEEVLQLSNDRGILTRPAWTPLDELPPYNDCPKGDLSVTRELSTRLLNLPSSPGLLQVAEST